jgi:hypothetical protein
MKIYLIMNCLVFYKFPWCPCQGFTLTSSLLKFPCNLPLFVNKVALALCGSNWNGCPFPIFHFRFILAYFRLSISGSYCLFPVSHFHFYEFLVFHFRFYYFHFLTISGFSFPVAHSFSSLSLSTEPEKNGERGRLGTIIPLYQLIWLVQGCQPTDRWS